MPRFGDENRARFPYLPFYVDDWLGSDTVDAFTLEQQGGYRPLVRRQWRAKDRLLPQDEAKLARWTKLGKRWPAVGRPVLRQCFNERQDGYVNLKLRRIWERIRERSSKARSAAEARWNGD